MLIVGGCLTACGHMTYAQLTATYLYSDHVFDSVKVVCEQAASVLENVGTVDTVLKYDPLLFFVCSTNLQFYTKGSKVQSPISLHWFSR